MFTHCIGTFGTMCRRTGRSIPNRSGRYSKGPDSDWCKEIITNRSSRTSRCLFFSLPGGNLKI